MARVWLATIIALSGISIKWYAFHSGTYPYTVKQPSSYRHQLETDIAKRKVDYFFPAPSGSYVTNVNIFADNVRVDPAQSLRIDHGRHIRLTAWLRIMGQRRPLYEADFGGMVGPYTVGRVVVVTRDHVWHLGISYAPRYKNQRLIMLKMLRTFKGQ